MPLKYLSIKEQQGKLNITDQKLQKAKEKLKELQHFKVEEGGFETKIKTMEEENKSNSYLVGSLSHDISEKKLWTEKLRKVLNEPTMSEQDRLKVQQQIQKLKEEIKKLSQKRDSTKYEPIQLLSNFFIAKLMTNCLFTDNNTTALLRRRTKKNLL